MNQDYPTVPLVRTGIDIGRHRSAHGNKDCRLRRTEGVSARSTIRSSIAAVDAFVLEGGTVTQTRIMKGKTDD